MPNTWKQDAQAYLGDPNAPMTPVNQDKVAYSSMKSMKDAGYSPEEIASTWNSGKPNWIGNVGTNQFGVKYDTPTYVNSVIQKYSEIKSGIQNGQTQPTDSTVQVPEQAPSVGGFIENAAGSTVNLIGNLGNALMHPIDTLSNLAGTVAGAGEKLVGMSTPDTQKFDNVVNYFKGKYGGDSLSQIVGNIAHTAYTDPAGTALDLSTLIDGIGGAVSAVGDASDAARVATMAGKFGTNPDFLAGADGVESGAENAINSTDLNGLGNTSAVGNQMSQIGSSMNPLTYAGKAVSSIGGALNWGGDEATRMTFAGVKSNDLANWMRTNLDGVTPAQMMTSVQSKLSDIDESVQSQLASHTDTVVTAQDVADNIQRMTKDDGSNLYPNAKYSANDITEAVTDSLGKKNAALAEKFANGQANLADLNRIKSIINNSDVFKASGTGAVKLSATDIAPMTNSMRDIIGTKAPEIEPQMAEYKNAIDSSRVIKNLLKKSKPLVSMPELFGLIDKGIPGFIAMKIVESPTAKIIASKILGTTGNAVESVGNVINSPAVKIPAAIETDNNKAQNNI